MAEFEILLVSGKDWEVLAWLWQCFRHDLAPIVSGLPYTDGRYQTRGLPTQPSPDVAAYLAWRPHPNIGEAAPIGFALVKGVTGDRRSLAALWVAPVARDGGVGRRLALHVINRHDGPWAIAFQHANTRAGEFWRRIADEAFGPGAWREAQRGVPGVPAASPDHWIETI